MQHPSVARQVFQAGLGLVEDRVRLGGGHHDHVFGQVVRSKPGFRRDFGADHEVDVASAQERLQHIDQRHGGAQRDAGCFAHQVARGRRQQELRGRRDDAHLDVAGQAAADVADLAARALHVEARALRPLEQGTAGGGEPDAAARLLEQRRAACLFEPPHAARERGLRAMQPLRRCAPCARARR
ncbi:hypothetical protein D9M68_728340 [compost metagenome]